MAAGLKSKCCKLLPESAMMSVSRYPPIIRACGWVLAHHSVLRPVAKLAAPPCRCVLAYTSTTNAPVISLSLALIFVLAPLPNAIFSHCGSDDFAAGYEGGGPIDLGRFITSMVVVSGFAFPVVLAHSGVIHTSACVMSIVGGGCVPFLLPPVLR